MKHSGILTGLQFGVLTVLGLWACGGGVSGEEPAAPGQSNPFGGASALSTPVGSERGGQAYAAGGKTSGLGGQLNTVGGYIGAVGNSSAVQCDSAMAAIAASCPVVEACASSQCASQLSACFGEKDASGRRAGGQCQSYSTCADACQCESSCMQSCSSQQSQTCRDCTTSVLDCVQTSCTDAAVQCVTGLLGGTTGAGGAAGNAASINSSSAAGAGDNARHTCAELQSCCARLTGTSQTNCQTYYATAASYGDTGCDLAWRSLGC